MKPIDCILLALIVVIATALLLFVVFPATQFYRLER